MDDVMARVAERLDREELSISDAASQIGVTPDSLSRHLAGAYVRSDSLAKYRLWVEGRDAKGRQMELLGGHPLAVVADPDARLRQIRMDDPFDLDVPHRVVDLFCGCGGLSLGFELAYGRRQFRTVLAIDIEETMVNTLNRNHTGTQSSSVGRVVDLAQFINETEVRAFYLDHLAKVENDIGLHASLSKVSPAGLSEIIETIRAIDHQFVMALEQLRLSPAFDHAYRSLDSRVLSQTSVKGFFSSLGIPNLSSRAPNLLPLIWADAAEAVTQPTEAHLSRDLLAAWRRVEDSTRQALSHRWTAEVLELERKSAGRGRGQLASSARRIGTFLEFLKDVPDLKDIWIGWRSRRETIRLAYFDHPSVQDAIADAYTDDRKATVILGGPPCQGFSRIGRGKIRSLRDDRVQVHYDAEAGDLRNRLFEKYVLFVGALRPDVFLFENVRHFQTEVRSPEGNYLATEVLAEAVRNLSADGLDYVVANRTVTASDHGVPQARERFFMVGVRSEVDKLVPIRDASQWILALPKVEEVPLRAALDDLPPPYLVEGVGQGNLSRSFVRPSAANRISTGSAAERFRGWVGQSAPSVGYNIEPIQVDGHVARDHRADDRALFAMMGPGTRWMDYRCDGSSTLEELRDVLDKVAILVAHLGDETMSSACRELKAKADGSLSLRLLLESIPALPGEVNHHLAKSTYLEKREGNHGDWLARLDPNRPSKTLVTHMGKDTYAYVHPWRDGSLSVREAARIQTFPDWFSFGHLGLVDAFRVIGNAVPPLLSSQFAERVAQLLASAGLRSTKPEALAG